MSFDVPVVILCGGRGMRLNERTESIPKPMVEIGGMPILWHIMRGFSAEGFRRFVLCLGYRGEKIREFFVNLTEWRGRDCTLRLRGGGQRIEYHGDDVEDWSVTFVDTGLEAETGARLRQVERYVGDEFFVAYGDGLSDLSLTALLAAHRAAGKVATMTCVRARTTFGTVETEGGLVSGYREKPALDARVNGGFFCMRREVLRYVEGNEALEREPMQRLIRDRELAAHVHDGYWACMDTFKDNQVLNDLWARGEAGWWRGQRR